MVEEFDEIDIGEITKLHMARFTLNTKRGPIVLRALSRKMFNLIGQELMLSDPVYAELIGELLYLRDIKEHDARMKDSKGLKEKDAKRLAHLTRKVSEWSDWFGIECFVRPKLTHPDQLEALSCELEGDDWKQLDEMLVALTNPLPPSDVNATIGEICVRYGVQMADGITAENITVQQTAVMDDAMDGLEERTMEAMRIGDGG